MRAKLRDLDATFVGQYGTHRDDEHGEYLGYKRQEELAGAQGLLFQCPRCAEGKEYGQEDGRGHYKGAHMILCWFRNPVGAPPVPDDAEPGPGRWWVVGTELDDLTFDYGEPSMPKSVLLRGGCGWHGFVTHGEAHE